MNRIKCLSIILFLIIMTISCNPNAMPRHEGRPYRAVISGKVTDELDSPLDSVKVKFAKIRSWDSCFVYFEFDDSTFTDNRGHFIAVVEVLSYRIDFKKRCNYENGKIFSDSVSFVFSRKDYQTRIIKKPVTFHVEGWGSRPAGSIVTRKWPQTYFGKIILKHDE